MFFVPIQTALPPSLPPQLLLLLLFPPPVFPFSFLLATLGLVLAWRDIHPVPVGVPFRDPDLGAIKLKTVHLPAGHSFKDYAQWGLSGCLSSQATLWSSRMNVSNLGLPPQGQASLNYFLFFSFLILTNLFMITDVVHLLTSLKAFR